MNPEMITSGLGRSTMIRCYQYFIHTFHYVFSNKTIWLGILQIHSKCSGCTNILHIYLCYFLILIFLSRKENDLDINNRWQYSQRDNKTLIMQSIQTRMRVGVPPMTARRESGCNEFVQSGCAGCTSSGILRNGKRMWGYGGDSNYIPLLRWGQVSSRDRAHILSNTYEYT